MIEKKSFLLYHDTYEPIKALTQKQKGDLLDAIFQYKIGKAQVVLEPITSMAFQFIKSHLDRDSIKWEKKAESNRENGVKGGRPKNPELATIKGKKIPQGSEDKHFIYLIHDFVEKEYKIGETRDLIKRRYSIKRPTNNLEIIDFAIASALDCQKLEKQIIKEYNYCRVSGDWFNYGAKEVIEIVETFTQKSQWVSKIPKITKKPVSANVNVNESDINIKKPTVKPTALVKSTVHPLYKSIHEAFLSKNGGKFTNYPKEGKGVNGLILKAENRDKDNPEIFIQGVIEQFYRMTNNGDKYWNSQPFLPSILNSDGIFDRVLKKLQDAQPKELQINTLEGLTW